MLEPGSTQMLGSGATKAAREMMLGVFASGSTSVTSIARLKMCSLQTAEWQKDGPCERPKAEKMLPAKRPKAEKMIFAKRPKAKKMLHAKRPEAGKMLPAKRPEAEEVLHAKRPKTKCGAAWTLAGLDVRRLVKTATTADNPLCTWAHRTPNIFIRCLFRKA